MNESINQDLKLPQVERDICCHCCPDGRHWHGQSVSGRDFMATAAVGGAVLSGLSWSSLAAASQSNLPMPPQRATLRVLPPVGFEKRFPRSGSLPLRRRLNAVSLQDVADRGVGDTITDLGEFALDPIIAPSRILFREPDGQLDNHLADLGRPGFCSLRSE